MAGLMDKLQKMWNPPDDEYEYEEYPEEEEDEEPEEKPVSFSDETRRGSVSSFASFAPFSSGYSSREREAAPQGKVVNINAKTQLQVVVCKPVSFGDEVRSIADELLRRHTVVLNLESTNGEIARRLLDFLAGVSYANEGKIKKVAISTYIITPYNVDILGDLIDELENNGLYF